MEIYGQQINQKNIASIATDAVIIQDVESAIDLIGNIYYQGYDALVLQQAQLTPAFFDLKTKLAGEVLQKFSNYRLQLAIIGNWQHLTSKSLQDFIRESNAGTRVFFVGSSEEALSKLSL